MSQKQHDFFDKPTTVNGEVSGDTGLEVAAIQLETVIDLSTLNTRAGLYIFLSSLLVGRPLTDDFTIINYLHSRYKVIRSLKSSWDHTANSTRSILKTWLPT